MDLPFQKAYFPNVFINFERIGWKISMIRLSRVYIISSHNEMKVNISVMWCISK